MPQTVITQEVGKIPIIPSSNRRDRPNLMKRHHHASLISSSDVGKIHALDVGLGWGEESQQDCRGTSTSMFRWGLRTDYSYYISIREVKKM